MMMNDMVVKSVDLMGDTIMAAKDSEGNIWAGINFFCKALGMSKGQRDRQVQNVQTDETLKRGASKLEAGVFDKDNETVVLKIEYVPLWLTKIAITEKTKKAHPELSDKLLEYQLKAKDILAAAFLPKQESTRDVQGKIKLLAQGTTELYERVEGLEDKFAKFEQDLPLFPEDADEVKNALNKKVVEHLGGKDSAAYHNRSICRKAFIDAYRELKRNFGVSSYKSIKRNQKRQALEVIAVYRPPVILVNEIDASNSQISLDLEGGAV